MYLIDTIYSFLCLISIFSALIIVSSLNAIHRVVWLIILFTIGAFMFIILDHYYLGLTYIIVYVGAIAILFLFVIMMVQIKKTEELSSYGAEVGLKTKQKKQILLISLLSAFWVYVFKKELALPRIISNPDISHYFFPDWSFDFYTFSDIQSIAQLIYMGYPTAIILISLILWTVMIGIIKITMKD